MIFVILIILICTQITLVSILNKGTIKMKEKLEYSY